MQINSETTERYRAKIISVLKKNGRTPLTDQELSAKCRPARTEAAAFRAAVDALAGDGTICARRRGYVLSSNMHYIRATVVRLSRTFGFVRSDLDNTDIFIPGKFLQGAMPQDRVLVNLIPSRTGKPEGEIVSVFAQGDAKLLGVIAEEEGQLFFRADHMPRTLLKIRRRDSAAYAAGDKVLAEVVERGQRHAEHRVRVLLNFGSSAKAAVCADALVSFYGFHREFPEDAVQEAQALAAYTIPEEEMAGRLDLRDQPIFTIDSAHTKDIDDAVSVERTLHGYRLGVHIADVSHFVQPRSALDREAMERGTSLYYANRVVPMLPKELSNGVCSLNPQEDRLAFSALMELDAQGEIIDYAFKKTVIRSAVKGVYSEVNEILDGTADAELLEKYSTVAHMIPLMAELSDVRIAQRKKRGAPDLETEEGEIILDENDVCVDIVARERGRSEMMIEEMMLLANEAAAKMGQSLKLPFVYRVHEKPGEEKIEALEHVLLRLGLHVPKMADIQPAHLAQILDEVRGTELHNVMNVMVLRSMAKAAYSTEPLGHFGLALRDYAHFTSPIRRYPDLAVHRILSMYLAEKDSRRVQGAYELFAANAAAQSTAAETKAVMLERDSSDYFKAEYMQRYLGEEFDGVVSGITDFGFYVTLPNTIEGLVHISSLPESDWINDDGIAFREEQGDAYYRLGDPVRIRCIKTDVSSGNIDFALAEYAEKIS